MLLADSKQSGKDLLSFHDEKNAGNVKYGDWECKIYYHEGGEKKVFEVGWEGGETYESEKGEKVTQGHKEEKANGSKGGAGEEKGEGKVLEDPEQIEVGKKNGEKEEEVRMGL